MKISIIIPSLDEENYLPNTIKSINNNCSVKSEIIVVDAGSEDRTKEIATQLSVDKFYADKSLRGMKYASLNKGASFANNDILLFLDADTLLPEGYDILIRNAIKDGYLGGAFNLTFDKRTFLLDIIRFFNKIRYSATQNFFGDQAIFCRRDTFELCGGYPEVDILEAKYFCKRLKRHGNIILLNSCVVSSSRRFLKGGVLKTFIYDLKIYFLDILGIDIRKYALLYWTKADR